VSCLESNTGGGELKWIEKLVHIFGGIPFIIIYNVITIWWVYEGMTNPRFFDPFPSNFYTFVVSWLAINMSAFILFAERRQKAKEEADEQHQRKTLEAILKLAESMEAMLRERKD
jgi:uncharacterized membrane protein